MVDWNDEVKEIFNKYESRQNREKTKGQNLNLRAPDEDWDILESAEFAFYQGVNFLQRQLQSDIETRLESDNQWFSLYLDGTINTEINDWICELVQNAFDKDATECFCEIDKENGTLKFGHNGIGIRGPMRGSKSRLGDVLALINMGTSLKSYDLNSEGRFGVGFKYWMRHFHEVVLNSDGFRFGWNRKYELQVIEENNLEDRSGWTIFEFSGINENGQQSFNDLTLDTLSRLYGAIRMRTKVLKFDIIIKDSDSIIEEVSWNHELTESHEVLGMKILSFRDSDITGQKYSNSTLMIVPPDSDFFPDDDTKFLEESLFDEVNSLNERRINVGKDPLFKSDVEARKLVSDYLSKNPFILGFHHEEGDFGQLIRMFPITNAGHSNSRISFYAPFKIQPNRLELTPFPDYQFSPKVNDIFFKMMLYSYGKFLQVIQEDNTIIDEELIQFILLNPPGEDDSDPASLDYVIRNSFFFEENNKDNLFDLECWPNSNGVVNRYGDNAKQLDKSLIKYKQELLVNDNKEDILWLSHNIENNMICFGKDIFDTDTPIHNWITNIFASELGYCSLNKHRLVD